AKYLGTQGFEVIATGRGERPNALPEKARYLRTDITAEPDPVFASAPAAVRREGVVFHLAAAVSSSENGAPASELLKVNVGGTIALAEAALRHGVGRLVYLSTSAVYGDLSDQPHRESDPTAPSSPYATSKLAA